MLPLDHTVPVLLMQTDRLLAMPPQQHVEPLARVLALVVVDLAWVAQKEVELGELDTTLEVALLGPTLAAERVNEEQDPRFSFP